MAITNMLAKVRAPLLAVTVALAPLAATAETLADAMVAAYRNSSLLDQNRALLRAADEDVATAIAALRPVVQWIAGSQWSNDLHGSTTRTLTGALQASLTLYDFGRTQLAIDIAKEDVLATREALIGVEQQVLLDAVTAYMNVFSATEQVVLQHNSVRVLSQEQQAALDRFEVGEITRTDVSQADARLAAAHAALATAEGSLAVAKENYLAATGVRADKLSPPPPAPKLPASLEEARNVAQRNHPNIRQAQRQVAAAELQVAAAVAERNPTLGATASLQRNLSQNDQLTGSEASVGLQMSQTIYSGGALSSAQRRAMASRDAARAALLNTARNVSEGAGVYWANIDVARAQIRSIAEQITAAQRAFDGVREEATLGARTTLDVLDSEQDLLSARADMITAEANLQLAYYQLLAAMGLLTVEHLQLGIPTYDPSAYYNAVRDAPYTSRQGESLDRVLRAIGKQN